MTCKFALALALLCAAPLGAQTPVGGPPHLGGRPTPVHVTAYALFQQVEGERSPAGVPASLAQWSLPVSVSAAVAPNLGLHVRTGLASSYGDRGEAVSGVSDTYLALSYSRPVGAGRAVVALGANVPSGGRPAAGEVPTAFLVGQGFYRFRTPGAGAGLGVAPSVAWAVPVTSRLVLGAGASYQYRGAFEPRADMAAQFDPGDELLLTGGADYRVGRASTLSFDASYVRYGTDTWDGVRFEAGRAVEVMSQWAAAVGPHGVRLFGQARLRGEREVDAEEAASLGLDAAVPAEGRAGAALRLRVDRRHSVGVTAQGRYYAESGAFSEKVLVDVFVEPTYALTDALSLGGRLGGTGGSFGAMEFGVGLSWSP